MIVWRGVGIFVPFLGGIVFVLSNYLIDVIARNPNYSSSHYWPKAVGLILAAIPIWFVGRYLNTRPGRVVIDRATGQEIEMRTRHDLFYVKFEHWAPLLLVWSVVGYFVD